MTLLEERVAAHGIRPWPYQPAFDRIIVWSLPEESAELETFGKDSKILKAETTRSAQKAMTARGILVAAGLTARDQLRGHGIELGHAVWVTRLSPWRHVVDMVDGKEVSFMFLRAGDVVGSEDVLEAERAGRMTVQVDADGRHQYVFAEGAVPRFDPPDFNA